VPRSHAVRLPVFVSEAGLSPVPTYYLLPFEGPSRALIHALKYERRTSTAGILVALMAPALADLPVSAVDVVVPVPLHAVRRRERGFNQAELLAEELARKLGVPTRKGLRRTRPTANQADLPREARMSNVSGAFVAEHRAVRGERVLLLDDVVTTGATLSEAAAALRRAGSGPVVCLAVAGRV
jgi:ComF family protein